MRELLQNYWAIALALLVGLGSLVASVLLARRSNAAKKPRSVVDYLLVWPLIFRREVERDPQRGNRLFTTREMVGWGVVLGLIVLALLLV